MIRKIIASAALLALVIGSIVIAVAHNNQGVVKAGTVRVVASYYPLYDFARQVGGNKVTVTNITPAGAEPHDYEPSPKVLADAQKASVFVYNGGHLELWASGFLAGYHHTAVKASQGVNLQTAANDVDPHFWLDPVLAVRIVDNIRDGLAQADPVNKSYYFANAAVYVSKLGKLDNDFQSGLATCQTRTIITSHAAFGYLAKRYNLDVVPIAGLTPDQEPSAAKLAELTQLVQDKGIKYVFFERLASPRLADTIASETGAKTLVFDPLEGLSEADQKQGKDYLSVQRENLNNLRIALACK
ncbi:MAG TPA: zinc ABC transporter substrate-binding protein [Patescibacteria group bacterium]|nr:zinc ABC transporter substrate-binding protein [Patescibacteria group bacterium]